MTFQALGGNGRIELVPNAAAPQRRNLGPGRVSRLRLEYDRWPPETKGTSPAGADR